MSTLADSLVSSSSRKLTLRMRPDLSAQRHRYHGQAYWIVKEPIGLNYFRFHDEEYAILQMLDGQTSMEDIKERFEQEFAPQKITFQDLQQFVGMLHRSGLVVSEGSGQGRQLKKRRDEKKRKELLGKFTNIFAFRWRGVDPERVLTWLYQYTFWCFSPIARFLWLVIALSALSLVVVQFEVFSARLPTFHQFFGPQNWIWLGIAMAAAKVLHEFGHGLSCKHFGGECHEMGFMMLVFTPALYCNVSDSWMLPNKWHRVAIGFAGMYVEIFLASVATFLWWFSEPGLLNHLSLSIMFICSVSTVMFNANPLLRFDGYYILMDTIEIPNLRQKATEVLKRFLIQVCLGLEVPESPFLPKRQLFWFGFYSVAAVVYRWVVVFSILMFLNKVLEPYGLKVIGRMIGAAGFFGLVVQPLWKLGKFFYMPGRMHKVKRHRVAATVAVVGAAILGLALLPLPHYVRCTFEVSAHNSESVYADAKGMLEQVLVEPGESVIAGQELARLSNLDLDLSVLELRGQQTSLQVQLDNLHHSRTKNRQAGSQIPQVRESLEMVEKQLVEKQEQLDRLVIKSRTSGSILAPPQRPRDQTGDGRLPMWSGSPLDPKNIGAALIERDLICQIGDPKHLEAVLMIDQTDIDFVKLEQIVKIKLASYPGKTYTSTIDDISRKPLEITPMSLTNQAGGEMATVADKTGRQRPLSTTYQARALLPLEEDELVQLGVRGRAKVFTGYETLGRRLYRFVARTFHFQL